jgi:hypothetical protein
MMNQREHVLVLFYIFFIFSPQSTISCCLREKKRGAPAYNSKRGGKRGGVAALCLGLRVCVCVCVCLCTVINLKESTKARRERERGRLNCS